MEVLKLNPDSFFSEKITNQLCKTSSINAATSSINRIRDENLKSLIARKKLHLVLDLDHTLLHSKETKKINSSERMNLDYRDWGKRATEDDKLYKVQEWTTKLRPNIGKSLEEASKLFDLSILSLESRTYVKNMLTIVDPKGTYFGNSQIITREDCEKPMKNAPWKKASLKKGLDLVLQHDRVVVVVDGTRNLWGNDAKNLIQATPYIFFEDEEDEIATKKAWSQWGDESERYGELARVLKELKKIHAEFYTVEGAGGPMDGKDLEIRDVRDAMDEVKRKFRLIGTNLAR